MGQDPLVVIGSLPYVASQPGFQGDPLGFCSMQISFGLVFFSVRRNILWLADIEVVMYLAALPACVIDSI